jgi:hypothetical protein
MCCSRLELRSFTPRQRWRDSSERNIHPLFEAAHARFEAIRPFLEAIKTDVYPFEFPRDRFSHEIQVLPQFRVHCAALPGLVAVP